MPRRHMMQVDTRATRRRGTTVTDATTGSAQPEMSHQEGDVDQRTLRVDRHARWEVATGAAPGVRGVPAGRVRQVR